MNTTQKKRIVESCNDLLYSKVKKRKEAEVTEFGRDADKIDIKVFAKIMERENEESESEIKETVRRLMKRKNPDEFKKLISDARDYTDAEFLADIKDIFGQESALFIQKELKYAIQ